MKKEIAERWTKALRSGEYEQGWNKLKEKSNSGSVTHCCLGVLCEMALKDGVDMHVDVDSYTSLSRGSTVFAFNECTEFLPDAVLEWSGVKTDNGMFNHTLDKGNALTDLNDGGYGFDRIAAFIERNWRDL